MSAPTDPRLAATRAVTAVLQQGQSLSEALPAVCTGLSSQDLGLAQELCYGTVRHAFSLLAGLNRLLNTGLKARDKDLEALLLVGLYQLRYTRIPDHAAIHASVELTRALGKPWAKGLVNGTLRNAQRQGEALYAGLEPEAVHEHPAWLLSALQAHWPDHWLQIVAANNARAPMTLRVNRTRVSREDYLAELAAAGLEASPCAASPEGVRLGTPCAVERLPGFAEGMVSVQDESAQLAATLLETRPAERVLDACSAPGGKTAHLLERTPELAVTAVDASAERLTRVADNLRRLGLSAALVAGDATTPREWWDGEAYDHILLDVPCSATGVIRRHPDIKLLRRADDIAALARLQSTLLASLWPLLKPGGSLLYTTCSVLPAENEQVVGGFLSRVEDAQAVPIDVPWGVSTGIGRQRLPGEDASDGFYYARLVKAEHG